MSTTSPVHADHWDGVYSDRPETELSWYQDEPELSLRLIEEVCPSRDGRILDAGAGSSHLVDALLARGYRALTLVDLSETALFSVQARLSPAASAVNFIAGDLLAITSLPRQDVWHDRAVFHFLTTSPDRERYASLLSRTVTAGGYAIVATFAPNGPERCSGLPVCRYDAAALASQFAPDFSLVRSEAEVHVTPTGAEQPFTYVVLRRQ